MAVEAVTEERWLDVPGYEGSYQVSDRGRVRSLDRYVPHGYTGSQFIPGRVMRSNLDSHGYPRLTLKKAGKVVWWAVHRLVLVAFCHRTDWREKHVNHIDGNKANNRLENLEWCTAAENRMHAYAVLGRFVPPGMSGAEHANAVRVIGKCIATGEIRRFAAVSEASAAGFKPTDISACCNGRQASHRGWLWMHDRGEVPAQWNYEPGNNKGANNGGAKAVERVSPTGEVVRYECGRAAIADGFNSVAISHCINGRNATHRGYVWRLAT